LAPLAERLLSMTLFVTDTFSMQNVILLLAPLAERLLAMTKRRIRPRIGYMKEFIIFDELF
jgi:hypothetical protein